MTNMLQNILNGVCGCFYDSIPALFISGQVGLCSQGRYSYGLYSYGLYSYGLYSHGLYSYGLYSHGLYSYGLCSPIPALFIRGQVGPMYRHVYKPCE